MKSGTTLILILSVCAAATSLLAACASAPKDTAAQQEIIGITPQELLVRAKESASRAELARNSDDQKTWALHGISVAEQCLMRAPEEPGCYYYRAVNTGLYHEVKPIGYQKGIKQMIDDLNKVVSLDPKYNYGGAYRILGQLYTKLPETTIHPDSVTRDLDRAEGYLKNALRVKPDYPENHIALAETLIGQKKFKEADIALEHALELAPRWRHDDSYNSWQSEIKELEKKIKNTAQ